ncbi:MAG: DUF4198 domain-containing protein [Burkholderiales bacterium]|nr:DUF4198 domain-containing protein [Burkholderiales bacterium]
MATAAINQGFFKMFSASRNFLFGLAGLLLTLSSSHAHDFWIDPSEYRPHPGQTVNIFLRVGQNLSGDSVPYIPNWFSDYRIVGPKGAKPVEAEIGDDPAGWFAPATDGLYLIGHRTERSFVKIEPAKFKQYLEMEGLYQAMKLRKQRGETDKPAGELYSRCAKSLVSVGSGNPDAVFNKVLGYTLELIPLKNPYKLAANDKLPVRLLYESRPIANVTVIAFNSAAPGDAQRISTDANGRADIAINKPGIWLIKAVHIIEIADSERAQWESFWASLTFRR